MIAVTTLEAILINLPATVGAIFGGIAAIIAAKHGLKNAEKISDVQTKVNGDGKNA